MKRLWLWLAMALLPAMALAQPQSRAGMYLSSNGTIGGPWQPFMAAAGSQALGYVPDGFALYYSSTGTVAGPWYPCTLSTCFASGSGTFVTLSGDAISTATGGATTVVGINNTLLSGLATGILKITTGTGVPSTVAAPAGAIVGTTDTQTLTGKTLDGVTPATMAFVDPTSSIQTQLNGKQASGTYVTPTTLDNGSLPANVTTATIGAGAAVTSSGPGGALASGAFASAYSLPNQYKTWSCEPGIGDGFNAIPAQTYLQTTCKNLSGATQTITAIQCFTDNSGSSTLNATDGSNNALLTGAITCTSSFAAGTQGATTTIAANGYIKFTFVADGTSKQGTFVIGGTY